MFTYCIILTLSPAVRERSWNAELRWSHWLGLVVWVLAFAAIHRALGWHMPRRDPFLLSACGLLSGWGLLTVWRLDPAFGIRQTAWLAVCAAGFTLSARRVAALEGLRTRKSLFLGAGLLLTALTLVLGTNPGGIGPRLWLGCCGVYFQPSEPLKLLLLIYLAAYMADLLPDRMRGLPLILPTAFVVGIALLLLLVQRDLGTASLVILLYSAVLYLATDRARFLAGAGLGLLAALWLGYASIDVVQTRIQGWLNPWQDPSGNSYQIVQSLLAFANGGLLGRGPGIGNPGLVPVAISDFVHAAIAEEAGLAGSVALLAIVAIMLARGLDAAVHATDAFQRLLAGGVTAYLGMQSLLILGGNVRALPLTGVTLPFVSYGGSSLLTSFSALFLLLRIGSSRERHSARLATTRPYRALGGILLSGLGVLALVVGWWAFVRAPDLLTRTDNARRSIADRQVPRGRLLDRNGRGINATIGEPGSFERVYMYPALSPVVGYTHPVFGQAGLEGSLDRLLRGTEGNPAALVLWEQLLYGTAPPGIDIRLSIDLDLQARADELLGANRGAIILMNAASGEVLAAASHPWFDPTRLDELNADPDGPLVNRATLASYPTGESLAPLLRARGSGSSPALETMKVLGVQVDPESEWATQGAVSDGSIEGAHITPLRLAAAVSALSNHGIQPGARLALAANTSPIEWIILPALSPSARVLEARAADAVALSLAASDRPYWQHLGAGGNEVTWFEVGTLPGWEGTPLVCVVALEDASGWLAALMGRELMGFAIGS